MLILALFDWRVDVERARGRLALRADSGDDAAKALRARRARVYSAARERGARSLRRSAKHAPREKRKERHLWDSNPRGQTPSA